MKSLHSNLRDDDTHKYVFTTNASIDLFITFSAELFTIEEGISEYKGRLDERK